MLSYKCPNCGRCYNYSEEGWYQCMNCRYTLKRAEEVKQVRNPYKPRVIGTIKSEVKCPYCNSTNTEKISLLSKVSNVPLLGIFAMGKFNKEWHCNNCDSDF